MRIRILLAAALVALPVLTFAADPPERVWTKVFGSGDVDWGYAADIDASRNVYVAGETSGSFGDATLPGVEGLFLSKYDDERTHQWTVIHGPAASYANALDVAVHRSTGMIYVVGQVWAELDGETYQNNGDLLMVKYDDTGARQYTRIWGSATIDQAEGVAVDSSGNVYVTGWTTGVMDGQAEIDGRDYFLTKWSSAGVFQWSRVWGSTEDDEGTGVTVDGLGSVYVAGHAMAAFDGLTFNGTVDATLTKYDSDGTYQWSKMWGASGTERASRVVVDDSNNVYVTGLGGSVNGESAVGSTDPFLIKVDATGAVAWTRMWGSIWADYGHCLTWQKGVGVFAGGHAAQASFDGVAVPGAGGGGGFVTVFDDDGVKQWTTRYGTSATEVYGIATLNEREHYTAGTTYGAFDGGVFLGEEDLHVSLWTPNIPDPVITAGPDVTDITHESCTIGWTTDLPSDSVLHYGLPSLPTDTMTDATLVTAHSFDVSGLLPGTTYRFSVESTTAQGGSVSTPFAFFITGAPPPEENMAVTLVRGTLRDHTKTDKDSFKIKTEFVLDQPGAFPFVPEQEEALIRIESAAPPLVIPIPGGDPGWKVKPTKMQWKSPKGQLPKVKVIIKPEKGQILVVVKKWEFGAALGAEVKITLRFGETLGVHEGTWSAKSGGRLKFP